MAVQPGPILNIYQRMILVQKAVQTVYKNDIIKMSENDKGYKATSHDDVAALLHLPLAEAGIVLLPDVTESSTAEVVVKGKYGDRFAYRTDLAIKVKWINADRPDDFIESHASSFAIDSSDKGFAKAYSLALKIVLLKVHLLESRDGEEQREIEREEPDDRQKGSKPSQAPKPGPPKAVSPPPKTQPVASAGNPGSGNPAASDDTLAGLDDIMRARNITPEDVSYWLTTGNLVDLSKPKPVSEKLARTLIDLMSLESFTGANLRQDADEMLAKRVGKVQATHTQISKADSKPSFIMPLGSADVKGKPLSSLSVNTLNEIRDWTDGEMKKTLPPKKRAELFEINSQVREEIKARGSK